MSISIRVTTLRFRTFNEMIIVFNVGSSSFKYAVFDEKLSEIERSQVEKFPKFLAKKYPKPLAIGHRIVHGGTKFFKPTIIDNGVLKKLKGLSKLAPLHNPPALAAVEKARRLWPKAKQVAVFDTAFFKDLPSFSKFYPLPFALCTKHGIFRFGFHGISHSFVAQEAAKKLKTPLSKLKLITCHLGAGCSITAIEDGKPIDTSMGFTPLEGLMMAKRCGDIDPKILIYLQKEVGIAIKELEEILEKKSGLLGISGVSSDIRDVIATFQKLEKGKKPTEETKRAGLALQMYAYKVKKYIGAYFVALGGLDSLVFTGAVGENCKLIRDMITHGLEILGDFKILVIPTNEELQIAKEIDSRGRSPWSSVSLSPPACQRLERRRLAGRSAKKF